MKLLGSILFLLLTILTEAQSLRTSIYPAYVMAHHGYMSNIESHGIGIDINYIKRQSQFLEGNYSQLQVGHKIAFLGLGNTSLIGNAFAYIPNLNYRKKIGKVGHLFVHGGLGLAYLTQKFDPFGNKRNLAISSHVNAAFQGRMGWQSPFGFMIFGGLTHFSNGAFHAPNLGINTINLGFTQQIHFPPSDKKKSYMGDTFMHNKNWFIYGFLASKEASLERQERFYIYGIGIDKILKRNKAHRFWHFGLDINMDGQHGSYNNKEQTTNFPVRIKDNLEFGLRLGNLWQMGRIEAYADVGCYIASPSVLKPAYYQKIGLNYFLNKDVFVRTDLVSHFFKADYFDLGIGYAF